MKRCELCDNLDKLEPAELNSWEHRFDEAERVMGSEAAAALKKFYDFYGKDFLVWLAKLYDPETGCFYYSNSARDNEGFLPDAESTSQTLYMLRFSGLFSRYGGNFQRALPERTVKKCAAYLKSLQSDEDGYFYHPQWGENINSSRRGRDFAQCTEIIAMMGDAPTYPTATERLAATVGDGRESRQEMPKYLRSEADLYEWLEDLRYKCTDQNTGYFNSYSFGHNVSSIVQGGQVYSAGLGDFICDYLDKLQDPETGFWEKGATYNSVSGLIKIGGVYGMIPGRVVKYAEKMIESCIDVILSDEDTLHMCLVFNPNGALRTALANVIKINDEFKKRGEPEPYDIAAMRRIIYSKFPAIVDKNIEKLKKFRLPDGSFSYFQAHCASITQGVSVAKRVKEGDVNATICAIMYLLGGVFGYLGIPVVPMANAADFEVIRSIIENAEPVKKIPREVPYLETEDFHSYAVPWRVELVGKHRAEIINDPKRPDNRVCKWTVEAGDVSSYAYNGKAFLNPPTSVNSFEFATDLLFPEDLGCDNAYSFTLESDDGRVAYNSTISVSGGRVKLTDALGSVTLGRVNEWIRLSVATSENRGTSVAFLRDGEVYRTALGTADVAAGEVVKGKFTKLYSGKADVMFDNIETKLIVD